MSGLHINDAGTWRRMQKVHVNDAGTWRQLRAIYVNDAGTWRQVFAGIIQKLSTTVNFSLAGGPPGVSPFTILNSTTPSLSDGKTLFSLGDSYDSSPTWTGRFLQISGFSSDPGTGYVSHILIDGTQTVPSGYSYSSGFATWTWAASGGALLQTPSSAIQIFGVP